MLCNSQLLGLPRIGEVERNDHEFVSQDSFLTSLARDEFVDYTEHHGTLSGVRRSVLEPHLSSSTPAILVFGTASAVRLKKAYPAQVEVVFIYPGDTDELRRHGLDLDSPPNRELFRRLSERAISDGTYGVPDLTHWLEVRMTRSLSRVAVILREMNRGFNVTIIRNSRDHFAEAVDSLEKVLDSASNPTSITSKEDSQMDTYSNANLPRKRVGATALYVNQAGQVLITKPTYRPGWLTPGGTVEENESPHEGCSREVREELGSQFPVHQLLCAEYRSAHGRKVENLQFVFWGGLLEDDQIGQIRLPEGELEDYQFCDVESLNQFLNLNLANRVATAMRAQAEGRIIYLENRVEVS